MGLALAGDRRHQKEGLSWQEWNGHFLRAELSIPGGKQVAAEGDLLGIHTSVAGGS